jgi:hypothetical protein
MPRIPHVKAAPTCRAAHMCSASAILEGQQGRLCSLEWWLKICNPWVRRSNCCCQRHNIPKYLTFELYSQPTKFSILILSMYIYTYYMYIIYILCVYTIFICSPVPKAWGMAEYDLVPVTFFAFLCSQKNTSAWMRAVQRRGDKIDISDMISAVGAVWESGCASDRTHEVNCAFAQDLERACCSGLAAVGGAVSYFCSGPKFKSEPHQITIRNMMKHVSCWFHRQQFANIYSKI